MDLNENSIYLYEFFNRKYFRKHRFIGTFECAKPTLVILDPALAKDIFVKLFKHFSYNAVADTVTIVLYVEYI